MTPVAVPYLRTSTDDKGQNPQRQLDVLRGWAQREGVQLLEPVVDEGSSASTSNPFDRLPFVEACKAAKAAGAQAVVVETADRFTRLDSEEYGWAKVELRKRYGLELWMADLPLADHGRLTGRLMGSMKAELGHEWVQQHRARVRSGMDAARTAGKPLGRPRKVLSHEEGDLVRRLHAEGLGVRRIALEVNRARGVFDLADPFARRRKTVSYGFIQLALRNTDREKTENDSKGASP